MQKTLISLIFCLAGIGLLWGAVYELRNTRDFVAKSKTAEGVVLESVYRKQVSKRATGSYFPRLRFQTPDGQEVEFMGDTGSPKPPYRNGEKVTVRYEPGNPGNARIEGFWSLWAGVLILFGLGGVAAAVGFGTLLARARRPKPAGFGENVFRQGN